MEFGVANKDTGTITITYTKHHDKQPTAIIASYFELNSNVGGEPKVLKTIEVSEKNFSITTSTYDGIARNVGWIAVW